MFYDLWLAKRKAGDDNWVKHHHKVLEPERLSNSDIKILNKVRGLLATEESGS